MCKEHESLFLHGVIIQYVILFCRTTITIKLRTSACNIMQYDTACIVMFQKR